MSRLEDLIQGLCPDGVEYKALGEVAYYSRDRINADEVTGANYIGVDNLLQDKRGKTQSNYVPISGKLTRYVSGDILIGNIRPYLKKIWLADIVGGTNGDVLVIHISDPNVITSKFLYYILSSDDFFLYDMQNSKGAKMPRGNKTAIIEYLIPIPPLPVQQEIVRILDSFTQLEAELEAELEARKKQYEYYRDKLLTFEGRSDILWQALGDICNISAGGDAPKEQMSKERTEDYYIPIISNGIGSNAIYGYTNMAKIITPSVTISARGTIGYAVYRNYPFFPIIRLLSAFPNDTNVLNTKFLFYCLQDKQYKIPPGGIPQLTSPELKKVIIPIPSLSEQDRIVSILDRFDTLCNDLTSGLPAEIEARRMQYEYYRDKLLTFKELST